MADDRSKVEIIELGGYLSSDDAAAVKSSLCEAEVPDELFGDRTAAQKITNYRPGRMEEMFGNALFEKVDAWTSGNDAASGEWAGPDEVRSRSVRRVPRKEPKSGKQRVIGGSDERILVSDATGLPWRSVGKLDVVRKDGSVAHGTGWFAAPGVVVTAGHCIYDLDGVEPTEVIFMPGANGRRPGCGMTYSSRHVSVPDGWTKNRKNEFDYGCVVFERAQTFARYGHFGLAVAGDGHLQDLPISSIGYPVDQDGMCAARGRVSDFDKRFLYYPLDTMEGQSGSPLYAKSRHNGDRIAIGIHTDYDTGRHSRNFGVRITKPVYQFIMGVIERVHGS